MSLEIQPGVRELGNNITQEWIVDGPILIFTGQEATRIAVDTWMNAFKNVLEVWPKDKFLHVINDFSSPRSSLTPYAKAKADEIIKQYPAIFGYTGIVIQENFAGRLIRIWYGIESSFLKGQTRVFYKRADALEWIKSMIIQEKTKKDGVPTIS
jgi:hypothetical protein